jgi:hypothetical protein
LKVFVILQGFLVVSVFAEPSADMKQNYADVIHRAVAAEDLSFRFTMSDDVKILFGLPVKETTESDGGIQLLFIDYGHVQTRVVSDLPPYIGPVLMRVVHNNLACLEEGGGNRSLAQDASPRTPPRPYLANNMLNLGIMDQARQ